MRVLFMNTNPISKKQSHIPYTSFLDLGGTINRSLISATVQIYEKMGMGKLEVYRKDLEQKLLDDTRSGHWLGLNGY